MTTPRRPDAPTPRDLMDKDPFPVPVTWLGSTCGLRGRLPFALRNLGWLLSLLLLWTAWIQTAIAAPQLASPVTQLIFRHIGTNEPPLLPTQSLEELLNRIRSSARPGSEPTEAMIKDHIGDLEKYLLAWPDSPWNPSVRDELARLYVDRLHYNDAIAHWRANLNQLAGIAEPSAHSHFNQSAAMYTRHLLIAGKSEELGRALTQLAGNGLDRGLLASMLEKTRQKHVATQRYPWMSFKCGVFALDQLASDAGWKYDRQRLLESRSGAEGLSVAELLSIASDHKLPVIAVHGSGDVPVPSVAHLKDGHFITVLAARNGSYFVLDPGAKRKTWVPSEDLLLEASGIYIGDRQQLAGWTLLPDAMARATRGRTTSCPPDDADDESCQPPAFADGFLWNDCAEDDECAGPGTCNSTKPPCFGAVEFLTGGGLTSQPHVALKVQDRPLIHQPSRGPGLMPLIFFKQYMESYTQTIITGPGSLSLSGGWSCSWFMYATPSADLQVPSAEVYFRGARREYSYPALGQGFSTVSSPHPRDGSWLVRDIVNATVTLHFPSGRRIEFAGPVPIASPYSNVKAVSRVLNRNGDAVQFFYDADKYLWKVRDADGRDTVLTYVAYQAPPGKPQHLLLDRITLPDGRFASFSYTRFDNDLQMDAGKFLTGITDAAGIGSTIGYPSPSSPAYSYASWVPNSITTPDGTSTADLATGQDFFDRVITITDAAGGRHRYALLEAASTVPSTFAATQLPTSTPNPNTGVVQAGTGTLETTDRNIQNTFYWGPRAMEHLSGGNPNNPVDPLNWGWAEFRRARIFRWLKDPANLTHVFPVLNHIQEPSPDGTTEGLVQFFDYPGKSSGPGYPGISFEPSVTILRHPDTGANIWTYTARNVHGKPLSVSSTWTDKTTGNPSVRTLRTFVYAPNGLDVTEVRDGQNRLLESRTYNADRQLTHHRVYFGTGASDFRVTTYTYDSATKRMITSVSPTGLTTTWSYAGTAPNLTVTRTTSPIASTTTEVYTNGRLTQSTDARGLTLSYLYDNLSRVTRITWPDQSTQEYDYTRQVNGQTVTFLDVQRSKDRMGQWTTFTYDGARRLTQVVDPAGRVESRAYCLCGALDSSTVGSGGTAETTVYQYQTDGRLTSVTAPGGRTVTHTYNLLGQKLSQNDGVVTTTYQYNLQGQLTQVTSPAGIVARVVHDEEDRPWQSTDANGITITRTYDLMGRPVQNSYPAVPGGQGATTELFGYPSTTQTTHTDQRGKVSQKTFDAAGRILTEVTPNTPPETLTHGYAPNFLSRTLTDGRGRVTTWTFDTEGRLTAKRYHGQASDQTTYTYRSDGRVTARRYYSSSTSFRETTYSYDASGNLTLTDYPAPTVDLAYTYDDKNRLATLVQSGLGTITLSYANGRLTEESGPWANTLVRWNYPAAQFRQSSLQVRQNATNTQDWIQAYSYDTSGRLSIVSPPLGNFTYSYTAVPGASGFAGALIDQVQLPGGGKINHDWDALGRLTLTEFRNNANVAQNIHGYQYDTADRRTQQTRPDASVVNYGYDDLGQLTSAAIVNGATTAYAYDAGWNMTQRAGQPYTLNDRNQVTAGEGWTYTYDSAGNRTFRSASGAGFLQYTYDDENQLIRAETDVTTTAAGNRRRTDFVYDGFRRLRIRTEYNWDTDGWYQTSQTRYVYDGRRVIQERNSANTPTVTYARGLDLSGSQEGAGGIGGLLARSSGYQSTGTWTSHALYHADGGGNVTFLSPSTYSGTLTRYSYDAYGRSTSAIGPLATANVYRFSSKELHALTGFYYYGYRFYDPQTQRWINRDPIGEAGGINLYGFVGNTPQNSLDFHGETPGDCYKTMMDAAAAGLKEVIEKSIAERKEYGAYLYRTEAGLYTYGTITPGDEDSLSLGSPDPTFGKPVGDFHTHGGPAPGEDGYQPSYEHFSTPTCRYGPSDKTAGLRRAMEHCQPNVAWFMYLGTPSGEFKGWHTKQSVKYKSEFSHGNLKDYALPAPVKAADKPK
jgi:RHS repeat-associated protein